MKRSAGGFTLIELLVVIAIVSVLAAILFPVFARARGKARQTACLSDLRQIGLALALYQDDSDEKLMPGQHLPQPLPGSTTSYAGWAGATNAYAKSIALFRCPNDDTPAQTIDSELYSPVSYFLNLNLAAENAPNGLPRAAFTTPALTVVVTETTGSIVHATARLNRPDEPDSQFGNVFYAGDGEPYNRHFGGREFLLGDGHVKWLHTEQVSVGVPPDAPTPNGPVSISPDKLPANFAATFAYH